MSDGPLSGTVMEFQKYQGSGNDFVMVDNRDGKYNGLTAKQVQWLCHRRFGVGADGVILLCKSEKASIRMLIYNADGSEAEMCGNGIRCLMMYARALGAAPESCLCETKERLLRVSHKGANVAVEMGEVTAYKWSDSVAYPDGKEYHFAWLNTGVPHIVIFVDDLAATDVHGEGQKLRHDPHFKPSRGTNVNFARPGADGVVDLRTYERGVEAETLACGTGSCATAIAYVHRHPNAVAPVKIKVASGDILEIGFERKTDGSFANLTMTGPATFVFEGRIKLP